jgi:hypothetical protein
MPWRRPILRPIPPTQLREPAPSKLYKNNFAEIRKGRKETDFGLHQISKRHLFLPLMVEFRRLFAIFCSKQ